MRLYRYFGAEETFSLLELAEESQFTDQEFDKIADLKVGESVEIDEIGRIDRVSDDSLWISPLDAETPSLGYTL